LEFSDHGAAARTTRERAQQTLIERNRRREEQGRRPVDSECTGAEENFVRAARALYARVYKQRGLSIQTSPAHMLEVPGRKPGRRRALERNELDELFVVVGSGCNDPVLDLLLVRTAYETGARQEGLINLRVMDLDSPRQTVWLDEKNAKRREQPITAELLEELRWFAAERGASNSLMYGRGCAGLAARCARGFFAPQPAEASLQNRARRGRTYYDLKSRCP
jgi:integrase